jgi:ABC-2 type transport system permease protein
MHLIRVFFTFVRNSIIRETMFQANFLIQIITRGFWFFAQIALFQIIYSRVPEINGWNEDQYFVFMATGMLVNGIVETFFMPNFANLSEQIRTGRLDFALLKPIDSQFLVSMERLNLAMLSQVLLSIILLITSLWNLGEPVSVVQVAVYMEFVMVGVAFFYAMMLVTACSSIWLGRNQGLYDFWFYITVFARYPRSIYDGRDEAKTEGGEMMQLAFSYVMPILLVITVPSRAILDTLDQPHWPVVAVIAAVAGLVISRLMFHWSLKFYRSASS